ncbi:MAG TPA: PspC domain-containing protein [Allosphingosinicella sp.]|jgi:phage shock protein C|uniref:PspC domain-containing protein n=1 Tax=Allosphingosinicella sp. TaxID=2823234 RepID=UPI002F282930
MNGPFTLDKENGKLMGVCAGFARWADVDPLLVRLGLIATAIYLFPVMILAYLLTGWLAVDSQGEGA